MLLLAIQSFLYCLYSNLLANYQPIHFEPTNSRPSITMIFTPIIQVLHAVPANGVMKVDVFCPTALVAALRALNGALGRVDRANPLALGAPKASEGLLDPASYAPIATKDTPKGQKRPTRKHRRLRRQKARPSLKRGWNLISHGELAKLALCLLLLLSKMSQVVFLTLQV